MPTRWSARAAPLSRLRAHPRRRRGGRIVGCDPVAAVAWPRRSWRRPLPSKLCLWCTMSGNSADSRAARVPSRALRQLFSIGVWLALATPAFSQEPPPRRPRAIPARRRATRALGCCLASNRDAIVSAITSRIPPRSTPRRSFRISSSSATWPITSGHAALPRRREVEDRCRRDAATGGDRRRLRHVFRT